MAKPTVKTKKTILAKLGSQTKAGTKGKKRSALLKNIAPPISNKQNKSWGSSSDATNIAAATHDNDTDSIVDQVDDDDVVLAGIPNHSLLSPQALQGDILDDDVNKEDDNDDNYDDNDDNHFGMEYNATDYDGRENSVAAVHQARLSASPSSANAAASIAPGLSTLSRNGLSWLLLQMKQWEYRNLWSVKLQLCNKQCCQCRINHRSIAQLFQDIKKKHSLWASQLIGWKGQERKDLCIISPIMAHYVVKEVFRMQKKFLSTEDVSIIMIFVLQTSLFLFDEVLMFSKMYISQFRVIPSIALSLLIAPVLESVVLMKTGLQNGAFMFY
jgi:hypothetical protein